MVLCFLSRVWDSLSFSSSGETALLVLAVPCALVIVVYGGQWCAASSPLTRRDVFFPVVAGWAYVSALLFPGESGIFTAAGALLILGGGILLVYIGYLPHRRWMAGFLLFLAVMFAGVPPSPMTVWTVSILPRISTASGLASQGTLALVQMLILCALFRTAVDPVEEFPSNEPLFLLAFSLGMGACLSLLLLPVHSAPFTPATIVAPILLLLGGVLLLLLFVRWLRAENPIFLFLEKAINLEWFQNAASVSFQKTAVLVSGMESFLSGEGALLWSLGIALLLYLVFRGG